MKKLDNRYLNLAGAPWTPTNPHQGLMLANYFAAAATTLCIGAAAISNPHISGKEASILASESMVVSLGISFMLARGRRSEAKKFSSNPSMYVMDTQPDKDTAPTSSQILGRINEQLDTYRKSDHALIYGMAMVSPVMAGFIAKSEPSSMIQNAIFSAMMPLITTASFDIFARHRQLHKIVNLEWVISDRGDAVGKFHNQERDRLTAARQVVRVTAANTPR